MAAATMGSAMNIMMLLIFFRWLLIEVRERGILNILWLNHLDERMLMDYSIFANFTEVKVLAHRAFVSDSNDGAHTASITSYLFVSFQMNFRAVRSCLLRVLIQIFDFR